MIRFGFNEAIVEDLTAGTKEERVVTIARPGKEDVLARLVANARSIALGQILDHRIDGIRLRASALFGGGFRASHAQDWGGQEDELLHTVLLSRKNTYPFGLPPEV